MPFTVSHAAAVVPFRRWLRPAGALAAAVTGAMTPDFGLFIPLPLPREQTHGRLALLTFCLPVGLLAWWVFCVLVRPAAVEVLPDRWWQGLRQRPELTAVRTWCAAALAVLGGALTHLVWDGFTHEGARGVAMVPALEVDVVDAFGHPMHLYRVLQHASSVLGLALLAWILWRWHRRLPPAPAGLRRRLGTLERAGWTGAALLLPLLAMAETAVRGLEGLGREHDLGDFVVFVVEAGMGGMVVALVLCSVLLRWRLSRGTG